MADLDELGGDNGLLRHKPHRLRNHIVFLGSRTTIAANLREVAPGVPANHRIPDLTLSCREDKKCVQFILRTVTRKALVSDL